MNKKRQTKSSGLLNLRTTLTRPLSGKPSAKSSMLELGRAGKTSLQGTLVPVTPGVKLLRQS